MRLAEIEKVTPAIDSATDLYKQKADKLKDKAEKADVIAKQRKQYELVDKARDNLHKQQQKLTKNIS